MKEGRGGGSAAGAGRSVHRFRLRSLFPHLLPRAASAESPRRDSGRRRASVRRAVCGREGCECAVGADEEVVVAAVAGGDELDGGRRCGGLRRRRGAATAWRMSSSPVAVTGSRRAVGGDEGGGGSGDGRVRARVGGDAHHSSLSIGVIPAASQPSRSASVRVPASSSSRSSGSMTCSSASSRSAARDGVVGLEQLVLPRCGGREAVHEVGVLADVGEELALAQLPGHLDVRRRGG